MPPLHRPVTPSLRALLAGIVDYAGLFPPAALPFDEAFANHLAYRRHPQAWMLGRFVAPVPRMEDVAAAARAAEVETSVAVTALATAAPDAPDWHEALRGDFDAVAAFHGAHGEAAHVDALELKLPAAAWEGDAGALLGRVAASAEAAGVPALGLFGEIPLADDVLEAMDDLAGAVAAHNADRSPAHGLVGLKLRLGGAAPEDHPPVAPVARAVAAFGRAGVPFKATAGLHHPVRHVHEPLGAPMHGFLNLFTAAALARANGLGADAIEPILGEEDPTAFRFEEDAIAWNEHRASVEAVEDARARFALSIGSCSFEEPVADLQALGLL